MDDSPQTRPSLLLRLGNPQDDQAWREFSAIYEPLVYRLARQRGLQDADAADLVQDVMRAVARGIDRWDPDPRLGSFRGWLFRIARNLMINFLTGRQRRAWAAGDGCLDDLLSQAPAPNGEDSTLFDLEYKRQLFHWGAVEIREEFTPTTWNAFWSTSVEGEPIKSAAARLGLSTGAVYIARCRVLARLREVVGRHTIA